MHEKFSRSVPDYTIFICKFKTDEYFLFLFLVYKLETFKNCKEVKHIMIIAIIYIFLSDVIFDQQLKFTFRKSSGSPEKVHSSLFAHSPTKNLKIASPPLPFCQHWEFFSPTPWRKGVEDTVGDL